MYFAARIKLNPFYRLKPGQARFASWLLLSLFMAGIWAGARPALAGPSADEVVGTGTPASCDEAAFDTALAAVQGGGGGVITFDCGGPATILFTAQKSIAGEVTIDGGEQITLSGGNSTRLFSVFAATLHLKNITLSNGFSNTGDGGAIYNNGILTLDNVTIRKSTASNFSGGAIVSYGVLTIRDSILEENSAENGGALYLRFADATTTLENTILRNNRATAMEGLGGAILTWGSGDVTIDGGEIAHNVSQGRGGGIYNTPDSTVVATGDVQIHDNVSERGLFSRGGGIYNTGHLILDRATIHSNLAGHGGGIYNNGGSMILLDATIRDNQAQNGSGGGIDNWIGNVSLEHVTLSGNSSLAGGGLLHNDGLITINNSTISGNTATEHGGGIESHANLSLTFVTIAGNSAPKGAGISKALGKLTLHNVILDNSDEGGNCWGFPDAVPLTSKGFNLASDDGDYCYLNQASDLKNVDPQLSALGDWGGFTQTMLPAATSPAVDSGQCDPDIQSDQRGLPRLQGAACDIGAVEVEANVGPALQSVFLPLVKR